MVLSFSGSSSNGIPIPSSSTTSPTSPRGIPSNTITSSPNNNNSSPIPIPNSSNSLFTKRKTSNAKYKPSNLSISSVRDGKVSRTPKQFEIPQEFYMYSSSVPNPTTSRPSSVSSSSMMYGMSADESSSSHQQPPQHHHHSSKSLSFANMNRHQQDLPFSPPSTSSAMMINTSTISRGQHGMHSVSSSFSNSSSLYATPHSASSSGFHHPHQHHHHSFSQQHFPPSSLGHNHYTSGYFNPHSYGDSSSVCYSLSSSVDSTCSFASQCCSPNGGSFIPYDKLNRKFRKIKPLGEGSSSTVSLVQQESTGLHFAEKIIEHYEERESIVKNEVKFLSICKPCPNVVTLYDCFQKGNSIHLILEYMEGNSIDIIAKKYSKLSRKQRQAIEEDLDAPLPAHLSPMTYEDCGDSELITYDDDLDDLNGNDIMEDEMFPMTDVNSKADKQSKRHSSTRRRLFAEDTTDSAKNSASDRSRGIPEEILGLMVVQVIRALCFLDEHNVIHSDIKPSNILLNKRGEVKLTDFGLSTYADVAHNRLGSFAYMSPEKLQHGKHSHKSDVYSLGVSILELSKCKFPFSESGFHMHEIQTLDVEKFVGDSHSYDFKDFVKKCIQIDPSSRLCASELLQHEWMQPFKNLDNDIVCSKIANWYNKLFA
ncbi:hypothetical protein C9374_011492 [Naegleria lovaniensis]|uniref:mitogen-activated protein kinase kinase n=1 Tax=Naegleria lovaniensis TaxID=51637 RepID=A0AA88KQY1_NAELO|nr:uncharacterized protein C9374_011492 [Naegleria lovaniensis]KAG2392767.1 hypothetical protein C9374_011492 [Naegleria lovaniensis]